MKINPKHEIRIAIILIIILIIVFSISSYTNYQKFEAWNKAITLLNNVTNTDSLNMCRAWCILFD